MKKYLVCVISLASAITTTVANADTVVVNGYVGEKTTFVNTNGIYVFASAGFNSASLDKKSIDTAATSAGITGTSSTTNKSTALKFQVGYRFHSNFAIEAGIVNLGSFVYSGAGTQAGTAVSAETNIKTQSINLTAVGLIPLGNQFTAFTKLGRANTKTTSDPAPYGISLGSNAETTKGDLTYGLGLRFDNIDGPGFVRLDWDHYNTGSAYIGELDTLTLGMGINF